LQDVLPRSFKVVVQQHHERCDMNTDQVKGKLKEVAGDAQKEAGKLTGDSDQQAKGGANELEGKTQKKVGDIKEGVKDIFKKP